MSLGHFSKLRSPTGTVFVRKLHDAKLVNILTTSLMKYLDYGTEWQLFTCQVANLGRETVPPHTEPGYLSSRRWKDANCCSHWRDVQIM